MTILRVWLPYTLTTDSIFTMSHDPVYYTGVILDKLVKPDETGPEVTDELKWYDRHTIDVDDSHIGDGYTLGVVKAEVNITLQEFNKERSPYSQYDWDQLRKGLLEKVKLTEGIMRFSKSSLFDIGNLLRVGLMIPTPHLEDVPHISLTFLETETFLISDAVTLYTWMYEQHFGTWMKRIMHPKLTTFFYLKKEEWKQKRAMLDSGSSVAKTYFTVTPMQLNDHYMKLAITPSGNNPSDTPANATDAQLRSTFVKYVKMGNLEFDLSVQVSEGRVNSVRHNVNSPQNDLSKEWLVPWIKIGTVRIPPQDVDLDTGVSDAVDIPNSKALFMNPCNKYHPPVESVGQFRCALYPPYDEKRQRLFLNRTLAACPFASKAPHSSPHGKARSKLLEVEAESSELAHEKGDQFLNELEDKVITSFLQLHK